MSNKCTVYHDGKQGRGVPGTIISKTAQRLLIEFTEEEYESLTDSWVEVTKPRWFVRRRRHNGGAYECTTLNCWFYWSRE